jgi:putative nucleotidyltransferase with HDIG domain
MEEEQKELELKDLLDSKLPILERFREMAPGTFKHSQNVSLLCESVALELDLDTDLMKVAGLYHDLGKLNSPELFSENQNGKNPHEDLDPMVSYHLITRHVGDTVLLLLNSFEDFADKQKLMEIISQHHGNTVLRFFYKKSKSKVEDPFRYKSVPPQSTEAAVLMICDSVEATARSLDAADDLKDSKDRRTVINSTVDRLMQDYQLDDIKVGMLRKIKSVMYKELDNIYHKREVYGDEKSKDDDDDTLKV